jgi:ZIP family zinc transporter
LPAGDRLRLAGRRDVMSVLDILLTTLIPAAALVVGSVVATVRSPGPRVRSAVQHFAAGVVLAAIAVELIPSLQEDTGTWTLILGFALGVAAMFAVKSYAVRKGRATDTGKGALLGAVAVDLFVDGLLVGAAFSAGPREGLIVTIALTLEVGFLGLAVTLSLARAGKPPRAILVTSLVLALLVLAGSLAGACVLAAIESRAVHGGIVAFGASALLYLVTEELLVEAHEEEDVPWVSATLFLGFLGILLLERLV